MAARRTHHLAAFLLIIGLLCPATPLFAGSLNALSRLIGKNDAAVVADDRGRIIFSKNAHRQRVPASILKILTSLTALHVLGPDYRFPTEFYLDENKDLTVKGFGDPLLISEVLDDIAMGLSEKVRTVGNIYLDDSYFTEPLTIPGVSASPEPYDAPNGALCANFNTVSFRRENGVFVSAESQTPLLPFALEKIRKTGLTRGRITLSHQRRETTLYTGLLLRYFLENNGVSVTGAVKTSSAPPPGKSPIHIYLSRYSLEQTIGKLLEYSNNFTANQLLIAAGAKAFGPPGNLEKAVRAARTYASGVLGIREIRLVEGSGISRDNRISAGNMMKILQAFEPYRHLMRREGRDFFKTGSLSGVKTRAGFFQGRSGGWYRYVIMFNSPGRTPDAAMQILYENL